MTYLERINGCWAWVSDTYEHWLTLRHIAGPIVLGCVQAVQPVPCPPSQFYYPPGWREPYTPPGYETQPVLVFLPAPKVVTPVPEPSGVLVLLVGAAAVYLIRRIKTDSQVKPTERKQP